MSDDLGGPVGTPMNDEEEYGEGEVKGEDYEEVEGVDDELTDPPYDPAVQAPKEAEW